jgi:hypothetical protein
MNTNFSKEIENLYNKFSYENINIDLILGNSNTNYFDSNLDKKVFDETLNKFIEQNKWVEIDRLNFCIYEYKNNIIKIYPNNFKTNHQKKIYYSSIISNECTIQDFKENSINNYIESKAKSFKLFVYKDIPVKIGNINKKDNNINKRSLLELENEKLFTNYFIPCINNINNYQVINKVFFKLSDTFSLHFDEVIYYKNEKSINSYYKIYLKIEINNDIANSLDNTINSKIMLPSDKQIIEKLNDIILFYNNINCELKYNISNQNNYTNYPKTKVYIKLPYNENSKNNKDNDKDDKNQIKKDFNTNFRNKFNKDFSNNFKKYNKN